MNASLVFIPNMISETSEDVLTIGAFINSLEVEMKKIIDFSPEIPYSLMILTGAMESLKKEANERGWLEDAKLWRDRDIEILGKNEMGGLYKPRPSRGGMSISYKSLELSNASPTSSLVNHIGKGSSAFGMFVKENEPKRTNVGSVSKKKRRRCWTQELHRLFVHAIEQLGDAQVATPKQITEMMGVKGLTTSRVICRNTDCTSNHSPRLQLKKSIPGYDAFADSRLKFL